MNVTCSTLTFDFSSSLHCTMFVEVRVSVARTGSTSSLDVMPAVEAETTDRAYFVDMVAVQCCRSTG